MAGVDAKDLGCVAALVTIQCMQAGHNCMSCGAGLRNLPIGTMPGNATLPESS